MRKHLLYRVLTGAVTLITSPRLAQLANGSICTVDQGPFNLAEAYPCTAGSDDAGLGIADLGVFTGTCPTQIGNAGATPASSASSARERSCLHPADYRRLTPSTARGYTEAP